MINCCYAFTLLRDDVRTAATALAMTQCKTAPHWPTVPTQRLIWNYSALYLPLLSLVHCGCCRLLLVYRCGLSTTCIFNSFPVTKAPCMQKCAKRSVINQEYIIDR